MLFIFYKLIKTNKIKTKFKKYFNIIIDLIFNFKHFFSIFSISLLSQIVELIGIYFLAKSLNISLDISIIFAYMPLVLLFTAIPISIGGWGVREGVSIYIFSQFVKNEFEIAIFSISIGLMLILTSLIGAYYFIFQKILNLFILICERNFIPT